MGCASQPWRPGDVFGGWQSVEWSNPIKKKTCKFVCWEEHLEKEQCWSGLKLIPNPHIRLNKSLAGALVGNGMAGLGLDILGFCGAEEFSSFPPDTGPIIIFWPLSLASLATFHRIRTNPWRQYLPMQGIGSAVEEGDAWSAPRLQGSALAFPAGRPSARPPIRRLMSPCPCGNRIKPPPRFTKNPAVGPRLQRHRHLEHHRRRLIPRASSMKISASSDADE